MRSDSSCMRRLRGEKLEIRQLLHGGGFGGGDPPSADDIAANIVEKLDENGDGQLAADEVSDRAWDRLSPSADTDESGGISQEELAAHVEAKLADRVHRSGGFRNHRGGFGRGGGFRHRGQFGGGESATIEDRVDRLFSSKDANEDGVLAEDEVSERAWDRLSRADADGGGGVSQEELAAHVETTLADRVHRSGGLRGHRGGFGPGGGFRHRGQFCGGESASTEDRVDRLFASKDANEDGVLTEDEVSERVWDRVADADPDGNGVSSDELIETINATRQERLDTRIETMFDSDANEDGLLTADEVSERKWSRPSNADADGNNAVSQDEIRSYIESKRSGADTGDEGDSQAVVAQRTGIPNRVPFRGLRGFARR